MVNIPLKRLKCDTCNLKIPKTHPKLRCTVCDQIKHLACQKLTKAEAKHLICLKLPWTCRECILDILPVGACLPAKRVTNSTKKFKVKCFCCNGFSYSPRNVRTCDYCMNQVHVKCWNNSLGCINCCKEMIPGFHVYSYELLDDPYFKNDKMFNPYHSSHFSHQIGDVLGGEDESSSIFSDVCELLVNCKYKQPLKIEKPSETELTTFSLNVRTLANKIDEMRENITFYENFDILLFSETNCISKNLPNGMADIKLDGFYEPIIQDPLRKSGKGGGLVTYINKRVCVEENDIEPFCPYSEPDNKSGEFQFIKIKNCKNLRKTIILGNVYRSPSSKPDAFNELYNNILQKFDNNKYSNKTIYIFGDFNQDLIKYDNNINCQNLVDNASNHGFLQLISRPTRLTEHSATLLDLTFTNNIDSCLSCNIITIDISDHLAIHNKITLGSSTRESRTHCTKEVHKEYRIFNEANNQKFKDLINSETWDEITEGLDAQSAYDKLEETYLCHYNNAYPLKSNRSRRKFERQNPKPWILPWLEDACSRKNKLYHVFVKNPSPENRAKYKKLRDFCEKHINLAKIKHRKDYFEKYKDDSRKQWQMINGLLNRNKKFSNGITRLTDCDGNISNSPDSIASTFNNYFSNVASNLKSADLNDSTGRNGDEHYHQTYLKNSVSNTMFLNMVDADEVFDIIKNFKNKSTRDTKISALKIANTSYGFTSTLAFVISKSFQQGVFPEQLKLARVTPIHKEGSKSDVTNYRPISLLTSFSKIYEKLMHNRISQFLESNDSLYEAQYGFRSGRSCEHALLDAQNSILQNLSKNKISLLLLIDFSKAFDMVDHSILLNKLEHYGIRGITLKWLESYLTNRKQFVSINGADSDSVIMEYGVPQGSILGPLLFIIYINDIPEIAKYAKFILYADDANIILTANSIEEINAQLKNMTNDLLKWTNSNGLALNLKKLII